MGDQIFGFATRLNGMGHTPKCMTRRSLFKFLDALIVIKHRRLISGQL